MTWCVGSRPPNVSCLPYQPLDRIKYSFSAADIHVVSIGDERVGIIRPCKIYGDMTLGKPILPLGPDASHLGDIVRESKGGRIHRHGDMDGAVATLEWFAALPQAEPDAIGARAVGALRSHYRPATILATVCDIIAGERPPQGEAP